MDRQDLEVTSDLCEEHGLEQPAELMRGMAKGTAKAYMLVQYLSDYNDEVYFLTENSNPENLYLDKNVALQKAAELSALELKGVNPFAFGYAINEVTDLSSAELAEQVSAILETSFTVPAEDSAELWDFDPIFPDSATLPQMLEIGKLFSLKFYEVVEIDFSI